jgi:hypothetical protein
MKPFLFLVVGDFVRLPSEPVVHSHIQDMSNFELAAACSALKACFASRCEAVAIDFRLHALQCSAFRIFFATAGIERNLKRGEEFNTEGTERRKAPASEGGRYKGEVVSGSRGCAAFVEAEAALPHSKLRGGVGGGAQLGRRRLGFGRAGCGGWARFLEFVF